MFFNLLTILGPTASGKTKLAALLANFYNGEIISADSRQVYKKMDIGTGKDYDDYQVNGRRVQAHLLDVVEPSDEFNLYLFKKFFVNIFDHIIEEKKLPVFVGGTGLYLSSILQNYKLKTIIEDNAKLKSLEEMEESDLEKILMAKKVPHNKSDLADKQKMIQAILVSDASGEEIKSKYQVKPFIIGIKPERDEIRRRIKLRLEERFKTGMIDEIKNLLDSGVSAERLINFGLEYRYITLYLGNKLSYNDMFMKLNKAINNFSKRQMTWFRKMEREGVKINWLGSADYTQAKILIDNEISRQN
jgi:tRNA dimethylallyltransferase